MQVWMQCIVLYKARANTLCWHLFFFGRVWKDYLFINHKAKSFVVWVMDGWKMKWLWKNVTKCKKIKWFVRSRWWYSNVCEHKNLVSSLCWLLKILECPLMYNMEHKSGPLPRLSLKMSCGGFSCNIRNSKELIQQYVYSKFQHLGLHMPRLTDSIL